MQHAYVLRNFYFWFYKGAGTFHTPRPSVIFRLQNPFQVLQGFILAQQPLSMCTIVKFPQKSAKRPTLVGSECSLYKKPKKVTDEVIFGRRGNIYLKMLIIY